MKYIIFIVFFAQFIWSSTLEDIERLSNQNKISYEVGIQALLKLSDIFSAKNFDDIEDWEEKQRQLIAWKALYNEIHNKLFVLTHIARIEHQFSIEKGENHTVQLKMKENQLQFLSQILFVISSETFNHDKHQFNQLSDLLNNIISINDEYEENVVENKTSSLSDNLNKAMYVSRAVRYKMKGNTPSRSTISSERAFKLNINLLEYPLVAGHITKEEYLSKVQALLRDFYKDKPEVIDRYYKQFVEHASSIERKLRLEYLRDYSEVFVSQYKKAEMFDMFHMNTLLPKESAEFLERLGINNQISHSLKKDLSYLYGTPVSQEKSYGCAGFALASDIEFELNKIGRSESLSPWSVYAALRYYAAEKQIPDCLELDHLSDTIAEGAWEMDRGVRPNFVNWLTNKNFCLTDNFLNKSYHTSFVSVKNVEQYGGRINFALLKTMIDHKMPPVLVIDSDARSEIENWINIKPDGSVAHVLIVVGYGTSDIDPFTLRKGPYFIVRDSFTSQAIHYKVSAENLLDHSYSLFKVNQLELDEINAFKKISNYFHVKR